MKRKLLIISGIFIIILITIFVFYNNLNKVKIESVSNEYKQEFFKVKSIDENSKEPGIYTIDNKQSNNIYILVNNGDGTYKLNAKIKDKTLIINAHKDNLKTKSKDIYKLNYKKNNIEYIDILENNKEANFKGAFILE
ncbi:MAG: hypothetical protein KIB00_18010 [Paeniclostridium sordellii]|nr:hypothetical protein [Paeniclostridium sordellii]